eukprot:TRINITY_DN4544_c0_g1_i2.p1 TRINITY_DN4544_c0_g1~~TRINITY_DN4544_c0_g1_i2.p1  ORF type:complete len:153 (-),score=41.69 TRINITY_DN4544_c0_g1_i2:76-534(-)
MKPARAKAASASRRKPAPAPAATQANETSQAILRAKKTAEKLAYDLQLALIDPSASEKFTSESLEEQSIRYLLPTFVIDVAEERMQSGLCGWPLCNKPKKKKKFIPRSFQHDSHSSDEFDDFDDFDSQDESGDESEKSPKRMGPHAGNNIRQ